MRFRGQQVMGLDGILWTVESITPIEEASRVPVPATVSTAKAALVTVRHGARYLRIQIDKPVFQLHLGDVQVALVRELAQDE